MAAFPFRGGDAMAFRLEEALANHNHASIFATVNIGTPPQPLRLLLQWPEHEEAMVLCKLRAPAWEIRALAVMAVGALAVEEWVAAAMVVVGVGIGGGGEDAIVVRVVGLEDDGIIKEAGMSLCWCSTSMPHAKKANAKNNQQKRR